jgi:signal peptidase II
MAVPKYLWGPFTAFGGAVALLCAAADQALKLWLLYGFDLSARAPVRLGPFIDLVLAWNKGISFSLLTQSGPLGQWALLAVWFIAVLLLVIWLAHAPSRLTALSLGLIIGGAAGNAIDRLAHGGVVDFVLFHITTSTWTFNWFVFNLADVAICAGVAGLLYESILAGHAAKAP